MTAKKQPYGSSPPKHLKYSKIPVQGLLETSAQRFPNKTAIICGEQAFSYAQLDALTNQFANTLRRLHVKKGDRIALFMSNIPEFEVAYFGTLKAGAVVTTISPLNRENEVEHQLRDSGAQTVVALAPLCPILEAIKGKTQLKNLIAVGSDDFPDAFSFEKLMKQASTESPEVPLNPVEDSAALQYTGGTTGTIKGAILTHRNLVSNALQFAYAIQGTTADVFLTALPLFHIYGMTTSLTTPVSLGATMLLLPKFNPVNALAAIERHQVTVFCGVPTMYQMLLSNPDLGKYNLKSIRVCISGAASLPPKVQKEFMDLTGGFLAEGYGLTEASPVTHCTPVDKSLPLRAGSIGLLLPDTEAKIVDLETGKPLMKGEVGELAVKGPQVMKGYWHNPHETSLVLCDGWLLTGDVARVDCDGYFYLLDRKKDLIKSKGFSVYPRELEDVLYEHPAVKLCAVVGVSDTLAGEVPKAYVVLKEGYSVSIDEIKAFVNEKLASYKAIREVEFRTQLPLSSAGKVLRRVLKTESAL